MCHLDYSADHGWQGTAPWNLEVQIAGPGSAETLIRRDLRKSRETLHLPIPKIIGQEGGTFQVDLVSVEDVQGCKRVLSVPGVSVNVRRIKVRASSI